MRKIAIVSTHPIQYYAPFFKLLAQRPDVQVKVFYTWSQSQSGQKFDPGFGKVVKWDIPLLEGYDFTFVNNVAPDPGSHHYKGVDNPTLNKEIEAWQPDAVLIIGWSYKSHFACMRYFKGKIPVLFRGDSTLLNERPGIKKIIRRLALTYIYSFIDYALYVGTSNKQYFLAHRVKEKELIFAPHAVDNDRFQNPNDLYTQKAALWKKELGIPNNAFILLYAGKFEPTKNIDFILKLAKALQNDNFRFILAGNGPLKDELIEKASSDKRIIFLDFQNQQTMPIVYRLCDVFLLPTIAIETWGLVINEAMACGKPVIVSYKTGCAVDLVTNNENGLIVDPNNIEPCKEYILNLCANQAAKEQAGLASLRKISKYSFTAIVDAIISVLSKTNKKVYKKQ